jgi:hypothetical protein
MPAVCASSAKDGKRDSETRTTQQQQCAQAEGVRWAGTDEPETCQTQLNKHSAHRRVCVSVLVRVCV